MIIRPISDLRNTNAISEQAHKTNEPIFITKNGYGDMVVMSMELFESRYAGVQAVAQPSAAPAAQAQPSAASPQASPYLEEIEEAVQQNTEDPEVFSGLNSIRERYLKK